MKAIVYHRYGSPDVLQVEDVDKPSPADDEVLLRVCAASVNPLEWHFIRGKPYLMRLMAGLRAPKEKRLGVDVSGIVEAVGKNVTELKPGDEVFGHCQGSFAEYVCTPESAVVTKPANITFEQAAGVNVAGVTALQAMRDRGNLHAGQKVLINGAAGGVGTFAVQIAKAFGAHVTGVCSTRNADMVRSLGADRVIDYTQEDFTRRGERYDLLLDNIGNRSLRDCRRVLAPGGVYLMIGTPSFDWLGPLPRMLAMLVLSKLGSRPLRTHLSRGSKADLLFMKELMEQGKVTTVIDRTYPLRETAEAVRYLEAGHARGKVVITVGGCERG